MSTEENAPDENVELLDDEAELLPLPERKSRASSLLQRLEDDTAPPLPVEEEFSTASKENAVKDPRQVYVGVHLPTTPRRSYHEPSDSKKGPSRKSSFTEKQQGGSAHQPPAERVRFILGRSQNEVDHPIFSEMDELTCDSSGVEEWRETARWLKFEEDVEEGGNRWSKPYVATVSLYSLFELRSCVLNGTVLLDLNATSVSQIADVVLDDLVTSRQLDMALRSRVKDIWLKKHRHLYERRRSLTRKRSGLLTSFRESMRKSSAVQANGDESAVAKSDSGKGVQDKDIPDTVMPKVPTTDSSTAQQAASENVINDSDSDISTYDTNFMRKIPPGAEGSMVLVGEANFLSKPVNAFVRLQNAKLLGDIMEVPIPTRFLFFMLGPAGQPGRYYEVGRAIATLMSDEVFHDVAYKASCREDLTAGIDEFLQQVTVLPPGVWDPSIRIEPPAVAPSQENRRAQHKAPSDGEKHGKENGANGIIPPGDEDDGDGSDNMELARTGRFGGGLILDIKRKAKHYKSDFVDALNSQCLASILFIYFACLAPLVTFGGVVQSKTGELMGAMEQLLAAAIGGLLFSLFAGQPLVIIGSTGPMLVFEDILSSFCRSAQIEYLPFRMWIGLWTAFYLIILAVTDGSSLVKLFTRFTQEAFATIIGLIFMYEGSKKVYEIGQKNPVPNDHVFSQSCSCMKRVAEIYNGTNGQRNESFFWTSANKTIYDCDAKNFERLEGDGCAGSVFLLSVILAVGTFFLVHKLKGFKTSSFFPTRVRKVISDFAAVIAVMIMVGVDAALQVKTPKLDIPTKIQPTNAEIRGWLVPPLGKNAWWTMLAASIPAVFNIILIFMAQQITALIVNKKEHQLRKGAGYHLDLAVVAVGIAISAVFGLPFVIAATVLSVTHVQSLFVESTSSAPGERPKFLGVREQRVTGTFVFILIGLTVFLGSLLKYIPMPVLYGLFVYMGASILKGVQFFERVKLLFMPLKHQPDRVYLRKVRIGRIHLFTGIQLSCLVFLWIVRLTPASVAFPLLILGLVPVRKLMDKIFTKHELEVLDGATPDLGKKKTDEEDDEEKDSLPLVEKPPPEDIAPNDSGINISKELKNCTLWKSMEGSQPTPSKNGDGVRHRKTQKPKRKSKHEDEHHGDDDDDERRLLSTSDAADLETMANEDDKDSPPIPLATVTTVDENDTNQEATNETSALLDVNRNDDKNAKPLRPLSV